MIAVSYRKRILIVALVFLGMALLVMQGLRAVPRGPLQCPHCPLGHPEADPTTNYFLRRAVAPIDRFWVIPYMSGVEYTVCNRTQCINYQVNMDNKFRSTGPLFAKGIPDPPQQKVHVIEPPPRQPPPRAPGRIPRAPAFGKHWQPPPPRTACVTVGAPRPCTTVSR